MARRDRVASIVRIARADARADLNQRTDRQPAALPPLPPGFELVQ
jgi:hypothetical protein